MPAQIALVCLEGGNTLQHGQGEVGRWRMAKRHKSTHSRQSYCLLAYMTTTYTHHSLDIQKCSMGKLPPSPTEFFV